MKRLILCVLAATMTLAAAYAQQQDSLAVNQEQTAQKRDLGTLTPGVKLGLSIPNMRYSDAMYKNYHNGWTASGLGGIFVDYRFWKGLSVRPELLFIGRGGNMRYPDAGLDYRIRVTYFDMRAPVFWTFMRDNWIQPYVGLGPSLDFVAGGRIDYQVSGESYHLRPLTKGSCAPVDFGFYFGAGCKFVIPLIDTYNLVIGAEFGYHLGLVNTFSRFESTSTAYALNGKGYDVKGTRKNHDIELAVTLGVPFDIEWIQSKCKRNPAPAPEPTPAPEPEPEPQPAESISVEEKECYSLDEMVAFITLGADISTKKICAFDDLKFDFGKATIRSDSEDYLNTLVKMLQTFPKMNIAINGHTDNVGKNDYNLRLSKQRSQAVADYLVKHGIERSRLTTDGFGATKPIDTNDTDEGRARNRRVEIDILNVQ